MGRSNAIRHVHAGLLCVAVAACGRTEVARPDSAAAARVPLEVVKSRGVLARRQEAQASFDAARDALVRKDFEGAATALSDAATFHETEAIDAPLDAKEALDRAAEALDSLAILVAHHEVDSTLVLDRAFADAHVAEAWLHLLRAHGAMLKRDNVRGGEELVMSVDHLERAAKDARLQSDSLVQATIADTRSLAAEMVKGMEAVPDETTRVTDQIERAIGRIRTSTTSAAASSATETRPPQPCPGHGCAGCMPGTAAPSVPRPMPCRR